MFDNYDFNTYYSAMLRWDDYHCFGLIRELQMQEQRTVGMGGSTLHPVWQAARNWLQANRDIGVYWYYNLEFQ